MVALALVAELGEIERFENPEHLISYAGLAPLAHDSDEFQAPRHLPFRGNTDCKARRTYERLCARGLHPNSAKVAAARDFLKDVFYCWKQATASDRAAV